MRYLIILLLVSLAQAQTDANRVGGPTDTRSGFGSGSVSAPSWVSATLATWLMEEVSGTRINAQGTTARNLSVLIGPDWAQSTTDKMEGIASASLSPGTERQTLAAGTWTALGTPISMGCWTKISTGSLVNMMDRNGKPQFGRGGGAMLAQYAGASTINVPLADNVWAHTVSVTQLGTPALLYINGAQAGTAAAPASMPADDTMLRIGDQWQLAGLVDECWIANVALSPASVCRICSCGIRGEQCTCNGTAFVSKGRNATNCGNCALPAACNAAPS